MNSSNNLARRSSVRIQINKFDPKLHEKKSKASKKKHQLLLKEMKKKQVAFFGQTQHNYMKTNDKDGE